jgi:hypothetical protein
MELGGEEEIRKMCLGGEKGRRLLLHAWLILQFTGRGHIANALYDRVVPELKDSTDKAMVELIVGEIVKSMMQGEADYSKYLK